MSYFLKFAVVLTVLLAIQSSSFLVGIVSFERNLPQLVNQLSDNFPAELTVTIKGGHASVNVPQPYFIPVTPVSHEGTPNLKHYLVIDTQTPYSSDQFTKYQSYAWLTKDTLFYYGNYSQMTDGRGDSAAGSVGDIRAVPLSNVSDMTINRDWVRGVLAKFEPWVRWLTPEFAALVLVFLYLIVLTKLIYLSLLAVGVWLIGALMRKGYTYGISYRVGLYAASLGFLLSEVAGAVRLHVPEFSVTALILFIVLVNLMAQPKKARI